MSDDVNVSIRRWRDALASRESIKTEQLDELQDHLEAELQTIPAQGLNEEERVLLAARRVGSPGQLDKQFFDADPSYTWRQRVLWMVIGFFALSILPSALLSITKPTALLAVSLSIPNFWIGISLAVGYFTFWLGLLIFIWRLMSGRDHLQRARRWVSLYPGWATISFLAVALLASFTPGLAGLMYQSNFPNISAVDYGYIIFWSHLSGLASALFVNAILGYYAWRCYKRPSVTL